MKKLLNWFGSTPLESITPQEVERRFQGEFRTAATWNRYRALLSLTYRLAIRNGKAKENPARLIPHKVELMSALESWLSKRKRRCAL